MGAVPAQLLDAQLVRTQTVEQTSTEVDHVLLIIMATVVIPARG